MYVVNMYMHREMYVVRMYIHVYVCIDYIHLNV